MPRGKTADAHRNIEVSLRRAEILLWLERSHGREFEVEDVAAQFGISITGVRTFLKGLKDKGWDIATVRYGQFQRYRVLRAGPDMGEKWSG